MTAARFSVERRDETIKARHVKIKEIQRSVDNAYTVAQSSSSSCFDMRCIRWILSRGSANGVTEMQRVPATQDAARSTGAGAFFKKASTPQQKLEMAKEAMADRAQRLHEKGAAARAEAKRQLDAGDKASALRTMRKAKQFESRATEASAATDALERQIDLLEQAALQSDVAKALGTTAKQAAKAKGLLSKAEGAVEGAAELRDAVDDVSNVLGEATQPSADFDEDDLLAELEAMTGQTQAPAPVAAADAFNEDVSVAFPAVPSGSTARQNSSVENVALMRAQ